MSQWEYRIEIVDLYAVRHHPKPKKILMLNTLEEPQAGRPLLAGEALLTFWCELFDSPIHMAWLRCGKIMEFVSDIFEKLKGQVERDCRFRIVVSRLEIGGYCATCSK